jgi:PPP family 3-phenylpropionic acid transporter
MQSLSAKHTSYRRGILGFSLFFALFYGAIGVLLPFLNLHFRSIGFSGVQISSLLVAGLVVQIVLATQAGYWFDSSPHKRLILGIAILVAAGTMAGLPLLRNFLPILALYVTTYTLGMISGATAVNLSYHAGVHPDGRRNQFGKMRLWGSVGFSVMALLGGWLAETRGILVNDVIYVILELGLAGIVFWVLPEKSFQNDESGAPATGFGQILKLIFSNRYLWMTIVALAMTDTLNDGVRSFEAIFMKDLGVSTATIGLVATLTALGEIPFMYFGGSILEKLGTRRLVISVIAFDLVRRFLVWVFPVPGMVMVGSVLNAASFPLRLLVTIHLINLFIPKRFTTTANGFISVALYGLGYIFTNAICGVVYDYIGPRQNYLFWSILAIISLIMALAAGSPRTELTPNATTLVESDGAR